jgi:uncharacterized phage-associated protein
MTLSARDVAAALRDRRPGLPTKKLHKLLYYCQGHHLAIFEEPLFSETISAWDMGPVVGALWYEEKQGDLPAPHPRREMDEAQLNTIGYVLSRYGALTGQDLENLTHSEQPWRLADSGRRPGESTRVKLEWIRQYFSARASTEDERTKRCSTRHPSRSGCRTRKNDVKPLLDQTAPKNFWPSSKNSARG